MAHQAIVKFLGRFGAELETYHEKVDADEHQKIIEVSCELKMKDFGWDGEKLCASLSPIVGVDLSAHIDAVGSDFIIVRINRPDWSGLPSNSARRLFSLPI